MTQKIAIITGITGQDGSYLAENLLSKNYKVIGLYRRSSTNTFERIKHITDLNFSLQEFDITDPSGCSDILNTHKPDELYNLAAQSHVGTSFKQPTTTFQIDAIGVINLLEAIKNYSPSTRFYQAGTSEMFGRNFDLRDDKKYQSELTQMLPQSPYGVAKLAAYHMIQIYRAAYNMYCCCGILFNHESPRRGENFVTRKITKYIGQVINNKHTGPLELGNLDAHRDWGHAADYVEGMRLMLQQDVPEDYVLATGETHSVKEFLLQAFSLANLDYTNYTIINEDLFRPAEVDYLRGDSSKARSILGWSMKYTFNNLVKDMVDHDIKNA